MKGKFLGDTRSGKQKISEVRSPLPMSSLHSPCVTEAAVQSPLTPHGFGLSSAPVPLTGGSSKSLNRKNGTSTAWESVHAKQADNGHSDFVCDCKIARSRGQRSCLKQLNPEELMDCHRASFGVYVQHAQANVDVGPRALGIRIHRLMWPLREPIKSDGTEDEQGRSWKVSTWKLGDKVVCRAAWERA
jgi:hypothetical protein